MRRGETLTIDRFIVKKSGKKNPTVLFVPTASSDLPAYISAFTNVYKKLGCRVTVLRIIDRIKIDTRKTKSLISTADIIYIGGGNYNFLLSAWKKQGIIPLIKSAYKKGVIIAGLSAGSAVLYQYIVDAENNSTNHLKNGIGILRGIVIPHYKTRGAILPTDFSPTIRKKRALVTAIEDNCGVFYVDEKILGAVRSKKYKAFTIKPPYVKKEQVKLVPSQKTN